MKTKRNFILFLLIAAVFTMPLCSYAENEELLDDINGKINYLERCANTELKYDPNEKIDVNEYDGWFEPYYLAVEEYRDYETFKNSLLSCATPYIVMQLLSPDGAVLNINGSVYFREAAEAYEEGGMRFDSIEILEQTEDRLKAKGSCHYSDGELFYEHIIELKNGNIDYIEWTLGVSSDNRDEKSTEKYLPTMSIISLRATSFPKI